MVELIILSSLVWLPLFFYVISRRGFVLILGWLFIAPLVLFALDAVGHAPVVEMEAGQGAKSVSGGYLAGKTNVRARELLDPTRILFLGILLVFLLESLLKRRRLGPLDKTEKFALIFSLILIASAIFRSNRLAFGLRIASDAFIIPFMAYFCARRLVTSEERLRQLLRVTAYMVLYVLFICVVERLLNPGLYYRLGGPFQEPTSLFIIVSLIFFTAFIDLLGGWSVPGKRQLFPNYIRNAILCMVPMIVALTWARAIWLAFLCSITMFVFLNRRFLPRSVTVLATGVALTVIPLIIWSFTATGLEQILEERVTGRSRTIYSRIGAWSVILEESSKAPVLGIGLNNLRDLLDAQRVDIAGVKSETHAHNSFLTILGEQGTVGLLIYLSMLASIFYTGRRLYKAARSYREALCGAFVIAIMVAYLVPALFTNILHVPLVHHLYVYTFMGAIAGLYRRRTALSYARHAVKTDRKPSYAQVRDASG